MGLTSVYILDSRSDNSARGNFVASLGVNVYRYTIVVIIAGTVIYDAHLIVLIQHFQIIYNRRVSTPRSPIQRLLVIHRSPWGDELEIVCQQFCEFAGIFVGKSFLPCVEQFGTGTISIPPISKMAGLYYTDI